MKVYAWNVKDSCMVLYAIASTSTRTQSECIENTMHGEIFVNSVNTNPQMQCWTGNRKCD